jgi:beta-lactamase class A
MADAIALVVPPDTPAYMKGGSIDWNGFHCMAAAGQMIVRGTPVTFCLTLNWRDSDSPDTAGVVEAYKTAAAGVLARVHGNLLQEKT